MYRRAHDVETVELFQINVGASSNLKKNDKPANLKWKDQPSFPNGMPTNIFGVNMASI